MAVRPNEDATPDVLNEYATRMIRVKAIEVCNRPEFDCEDCQDIEQELTLFLLQNAHRFDRQRGALNTFINRVIRSRINNLLRNRSSQRVRPCEGNHLVSTETKTSGYETSTIEDTLADKDGHRRLSTAGVTAVERSSLMMDVDAAIESMAVDLRPLARAMMLYRIGEAKEKLGLTERNYARKMKAIREHFDVRGLKLPSQV